MLQMLEFRSARYFLSVPFTLYFEFARLFYLFYILSKSSIQAIGSQRQRAEEKIKKTLNNIN